jgi:hypothetical protein
VVITIPLASIGATIGTVIDDIYGLTYVTRALSVTDTIPDAKSAVNADESLGSYVIGGGLPDAGGAIAAAKNVTENLTAPSFLHEFGNATSDDYTLNFTVSGTNVTLQRTAAVTAGSANVTVLRNGTVVASFLVTNQTHPAGNATAGGTGGNGTAGNATGNTTGANAGEGNSTGNATAGNATANATANAATPVPASEGFNATANATGPLVIGNATGNWTITIDYEGFVGTLGLAVEDYAPIAPASVAETHEHGAAAKDSPGFGLVAASLGVIAVAVALRRRR